MDSPWLLGGALVGGGVAALTALVVELASLVRSLRPDPHPSARHATAAASRGGGPVREGERSLPVKRVERLVFVIESDEQEPYYFSYMLIGRKDEFMDQLMRGSCLLSEGPLVLSTCIAAWEKWIKDQGAAAGVESG